jgi:tetratricopeptide (TPR) repeat protein
MSDSTMPHPSQILRIVLASPGDVEAERHVVSAVVEQVNRGVARERGLVLELRQWEKDAFPGFHAQGPQALIDSILGIPDCDIFLGIFWRRFGTPVSDAKSGTEHEYNLAYEAWKTKRRPQIFFYFNQRAYSPKTKEETDQWGMVLEFRKNFPKEGLWWPFTGKEKFQGLLRDHLENFLRTQYPIGVSPLPLCVPHASPAVVLNALHQLPPRPPYFTGREDELKELIATIQDKGVALVGLHGMGGIGKTALALKLAEQLTPHYPDAQIFLDLRGTSENPLTAGDALFYVIRAFHPEAKRPDGEAELAATYRSTLHGKRGLVVMDNAYDAAQVAPLPPPPGSLLIITSRFYVDVEGLRVKDLGPLPSAAAHSLLLAIAPRIDGHAGVLAKLCGYLPLALRSVASTLAKRVDISPGAYAQRLAEGREKLDAVEASLRLSYHMLSPELQKRFRSLGVFPGTFAPAAAASLWELEIGAAMNATGVLLGYSLLEWAADLQRYRLHDLIRQFALHEATPDERDIAARRHARVFVEVLNAANNLYRQGGEGIKLGLGMYDVELGNINAGQAWAADHAAAEDEAAHLCSRYAGAGSLLDLRQHPRQGIEWLEPALAVARRLKDRRAEGIHLGNLGLAYRGLGKTRRAVECHETALVIAREIGHRRDEGNALGNLGNAHGALGETRRAIDLYEQQLTVAREISDHHGEGTALGNLGGAYYSLGEPRRAIEFYEKSLAIDCEIGDRLGEGIALSNLGIAYKSLGEPHRAIEYYEKALAIHRQIRNRRGEGSVLVLLC